jgi:HK97 family phage portal protein
MYDRFTYDYATLYRTQPNIRTCVDFLARNVAQLGLHVFRRVNETDRQRLRDHPLALLLARPLPPEYKVTTYRLIENLMGDLGVYHNAFLLKVRTDQGVVGLLRVPVPLVIIKGTLVPISYVIAIGGRQTEVASAEVIHFRGYNAGDPVVGLSPLETLRRVLAEEHASGKYREGFWQNAARMSGVIERPAEAAEWSDPAFERFRASWKQLYAGDSASGETAVLEDGMTFRQISFSAQESEYLLGRKLTREECARAFHIPLPMVGILDNATFSNIREQHQNLYQDCLGPTLAMLEQEINLQLLPDFADSEGVYVEFNLFEKLQGSFEDQAKVLQSAIGRPWMTADEGRARMNMPSMGGNAEELALPLNIMVGAAAETQPPPGIAGAEIPKGKKAAVVDATHVRLWNRHREQWTGVIQRHFRRQEAAILSRMPAKAAKQSIAEVWVDGARWNRELQADLLRLNTMTAEEWAARVSEELDGFDFDSERMQPYLDERSRIAAEETNGATRDQLVSALADPDDPHEAVRNVFALAITVRAAVMGRSGVTGAANFGSREAAQQGGLKTKTWHVNSGNPRSMHAILDGVTVGIREEFPNGMLWPGDPGGGADNNANCQCSLSFGT